MSKKSLLYIGHSYHNKTKSTCFLKDLLETKYQLTVLDFNPANEPYDKLNGVKGQFFDVVVLFQIAPDLNRLKHFLRTKQWVFFPMYDAVENATFDFWFSFKEAKIINFSKTLHEKIKSFGLDTSYIQYFPQSIEKKEPSQKDTIYFWQRVSSIQLALVEKLFSKIKLKKIFLHKALDPSHHFEAPSQALQGKIEASSWYNTKEEMLRILQKASIYMAPRPTEGIGMSFLEAMAMGLCVVANNKPTMNEYIEHKKTGILYDLENPEPLEEFDALEIGKNAQNYIKQGYLQWEKEKFNILKWIDEPVQIDVLQLNNQFDVLTCKLFFFIEIFRILRTPYSIKINLFKFIPFLTIKK